MMFFIKAFNTYSHSILIDKQMKYRLNKKAVSWTEIASLLGLKDIKFNWRPVTACVSQG